MFKKSLAIALSLIMIFASAFSSFAIDLNSLKTDSKVIADLLAKTFKEATVLALKSKDIQMSLVTSGEKGNQYKGLSIINKADGDAIEIQFGISNQRKNFKTTYETMKPLKGSLYKTYINLSGTVLGSSVTGKVIPEAFTALNSARSTPVPDVTTTATQRASAPSAENRPKAFVYEFNTTDRLDTTVTGENLFYSAFKLTTLSSTNLLDSNKKVKAGIGNVVIAMDQQWSSKRDYVKMIKGLYEGLTKTVKDTDVKFESNYNDQFNLALSDKQSKKPIGGVEVALKTGEVNVSAGSEKGLAFFKSVTDIVLKQVDPSGKTSFDSTLKPYTALLDEYQKFETQTGMRQAYSYLNNSGQTIAVDNEQKFLSTMMPSFKLSSPVVQKNGAMAIKFKISLFDSYLYVKDGSYHLIIDLY